MLSGQGVVILGSTYTLGALVTISGTTLSIGSGNLIIGSSTVALPGSGSDAVITPVPSIGSNRIQPLPNGRGEQIGDTTYTPGAQVTIAGTPVSVGASSIVVLGNTFKLPLAETVSPLPMVGGEQIQPLSDGPGIQIDGVTYKPGAQATISGTSISVGSTNLVIASKTYALSDISTSIAESTLFGGQISTAANGAIVLPNSITISAGGTAATVSGTPVSILPNHQGLLVDGTTVALPL